MSDRCGPMGMSVLSKEPIILPEVPSLSFSA